MNKIIVGVLSFIIVVSVGINIFFLCGKGINIDKRITNHQEQYQQQFQGQLSMNMWMARGDVVSWQYKDMTDFKSIKEYCAFKNTLDPTSSYFSEVVFIQEKLDGGSSFVKGYLAWPSFLTKTMDKEIKK